LAKGVLAKGVLAKGVLAKGVLAHRAPADVDRQKIPADACWPMMPLALLLRVAMAGLMLGTASCERSRSEPVTDQPIRVAAASDLTGAFEEIGALFEKRTGQRVSFSFGSSGLLSRQIAEGAPFDVFAAASNAYVDQVVSAGACDGGTKAPYARGRLVLWVRKRRPLPASVAVLDDPAVKRVAIANPEHAPYGKAAKEALAASGVWDKLESRVVLAENVRQALQFAESGNADVALVALSVAIANESGHYAVVEEKLHAPLIQALVACKRGARADAGQKFAKFVNERHARAVMRRYGFIVP
jgi:molybdate transport system substrate-binding protein